jgi:hypothetical protein
VNLVTQGILIYMNALPCLTQKTLAADEIIAVPRKYEQNLKGLSVYVRDGHS